MMHTLRNALTTGIVAGALVPTSVPATETQIGFVSPNAAQECTDAALDGLNYQINALSLVNKKRQAVGFMSLKFKTDAITDLEGNLCPDNFYNEATVSLSGGGNTRTIYAEEGDIEHDSPWTSHFDFNFSDMCRSAIRHGKSSVKVKLRSKLTYNYSDQISDTVTYKDNFGTLACKGKTSFAVGDV